MLHFINKHKEGFWGTIVMHTVILLLMLFLGFKPPTPEEEVIVIDFGDKVNVSAGSRPVAKPEQPRQQAPEKAPEQPTPKPEPAKPTPPPASPPAKTAPPKVKVETPKGSQKVQTQDFEKSAAVDAGSAKPVKAPTKEELEQQRIERQKQEQLRLEQQRIEQERLAREEAERKERERQEAEQRKAAEIQARAANAFSGAKQQAGQTQSASPQTTGNAGQNKTDDGSPEYSLQGRNSDGDLKKPAYPGGNVEGKVVVTITVNADGTVTKAEPGAKGSNTMDPKLLAAAKTAALQARFNKVPDANDQTGTITYYFRLE
ncbi:MAG: TonB family protein [Bacteroidales bacterium]|jgi:TonB family protein|nr:TonB family protein [Bacteroidales bacterium]